MDNKSQYSLSDFLKNNPLPIDAINSAQAVAEHMKARKSEYEMLRDSMNQQVQHNILVEEGAKANIETRDQLIEQNELLRQQLAEQIKINEQLSKEFKMGAREAVITRKIAYWSLALGCISLLISILTVLQK